MKDIPFTPLPMLPPEMLSAGNKRDCIRVRNLPVECGIEQILEFLGVHSQHIVSKLNRIKIVAEFNEILCKCRLTYLRFLKVYIWFSMLTFVF